MVPSVDELSKKKCVPCEGGANPLPKKEAEEQARSLKDWKLTSDGKSVRAEYSMKNFVAAVELIKKITDIAQEENHHPDIHLTNYRNLVIELSTHAIGGLSENDFIVAAKIEKLPKELKAAK